MSQDDFSSASYLRQSSKINPSGRSLTEKEVFQIAEEELNETQEIYERELAALRLMVKGKRFARKLYINLLSKSFQLIQI